MITPSSGFGTLGSIDRGEALNALNVLNESKAADTPLRLTRHGERTGRIDWSGFWSRRFRRLVPASLDSAKTFAEPILRAWNLDCQWIAAPSDKPRFAEHFRRCQTARIPGVSLLAEGAP